MKKKKLKKLNTGGQIGSVAGTIAGSFIPGVGPVLGNTIGRTIGGLFGRRRRREPEVIHTGVSSQGVPHFQFGGGIPTATPIGPDAVRYEGASHEEGGIPIDPFGNPTNRSNAIAEVEGNETRQGDYIFSDELMVPGESFTFAEAHQLLLEEGAGEEEIQQLAQLQEEVRGGEANSQIMQAGGNIPERTIEEIARSARKRMFPTNLGGFDDLGERTTRALRTARRKDTLRNIGKVAGRVGGRALGVASSLIPDVVEAKSSDHSYLDNLDWEGNLQGTSPLMVPSASTSPANINNPAIYNPYDVNIPYRIPNQEYTAPGRIVRTQSRAETTSDAFREDLNRARAEEEGISPQETRVDTTTESNQPETNVLNTNVSVVDYMNSEGLDSSYQNRKQLAEQLGIENYRGTAAQNVELLRLLRNPSQEEQIDPSSVRSTRTVEVETFDRGIPEMRGGGWFNRGVTPPTPSKVSVDAKRTQLEDLDIDKMNSFGGDSNFDWKRAAGLIIPSATRLGAAAFSPKPQRTRRVNPQTISENNPAFSEGRRSLAAGFRARGDQGAYADYTTGVNRLAASRAQDRLTREQINAQIRSGADATNLQSEIRDADNLARFQANQIQLITDAIELPIQALAVDDASKRSMMANIALMASRLEGADRERFMDQILELINAGDVEGIRRATQQ